MNLIEIFTLIQALSFVFTAGVALKIYQMQKKDTEEDRLREGRVDLTQAYSRFNAEVLRSRSNISLMRELFYAQYTDYEVERIEFMFLILNTLYMEWHFHKDHTHSEEYFNRTLRSLMVPLTRNIQNTQQNSFLIRDFDRIFADFPDEFIKTVLECIKSTSIIDRPA